MQIPRSMCQTVDALTMRWGVACETVLTWAMDGHYRLAVALPAVRSGEETISGVLGIEPVDVRPLFRQERPAKRVSLLRVRDQARRWLPITWPAGGAVVQRDDVVLPVRDIERFEIASGFIHDTLREMLEYARNAAPARGAAGPKTRYDWDAFYAAVVRRIHYEGVPESQAALVREMAGWFAERGDSVPDASVIKRKLRPIWQALQAG